MRILRIYSFNNFHMQHTAALITVTMLYITFLVLIYFITGSVYLLINFIQLSPHTLPLVTTNLVSFSFSF